MLYSLLLMVHIVAALTLVILVLLQHGKGADVGAYFGAGASQTIFGSQGANVFLVKVTVTCAAIFFGTSITLSNLTAKAARASQAIQLSVPTAPAVPTPPAPVGN